MVDCPRCKTACAPRQLAKLEVDVCATCKGIWLDRGELTGAVNHAEELRDRPGKPLASDLPLDCPKCPGKRMEKYVYGGKTSSDVMIDRCAECGGTWLDAGELRRIAEGYGIGMPASSKSSRREPVQATKKSGRARRVTAPRKAAVLEPEKGVIGFLRRIFVQK